MLLNNRFKVIKQLSQGGFGETFLAEDTHMPSQRRCVIKQLRPEVPNEKCYDIALRKFKEEAAILEELDHVQIPRLYGYFEQDGQFYLSQQWIDGQTLGEKVILDGPMLEADVLAMMARLLPVFEYLHAHKVVHRDVKPDNIVVRQSDELPVLIDFGSVKQHLKTTMSPSGGFTCSVLIGTEGFAAPEQSAQRIVYSSDLYGLGITGIYLLTGKLPQEIDKDPQTGEILWHPLVPEVSPELKGIIDKSIEFSPRDRYASAGEMLKALHPLLPTTPTKELVASPVISGAATAASASQSTTIQSVVKPKLNRVAPLAETMVDSPPARKPVQARKLPLGIAGLILAASSILAFYVGSVVTAENGKSSPKAVSSLKTPLTALISKQMEEGDQNMAVLLALDVPQESKESETVQEMFAEMASIPLGSEMDRELDISNYSKPVKFRKRSLKGFGVTSLDQVDDKTASKQLRTQLGLSPVNVHPSVLSNGNRKPKWPAYEALPSQTTKADIDASWKDPWREIYSFKDKMSLRVLYGCRTNIVLQNAAVFKPTTELPYMQAWLKEMIPDLSKQEMKKLEAKLAAIYEGDRAGDSTFATIVDNVQLMMLKDKENLIIATRII